MTIRKKGKAVLSHEYNLTGQFNEHGDFSKTFPWSYLILKSKQKAEIMGLFLAL